MNHKIYKTAASEKSNHFDQKKIYICLLQVIYTSLQQRVFNVVSNLLQCCVCIIIAFLNAIIVPHGSCRVKNGLL